MEFLIAFYLPTDKSLPLVLRVYTLFFLFTYTSTFVLSKKDKFFFYRKKLFLYCPKILLFFYSH